MHSCGAGGKRPGGRFIFFGFFYNKSKSEHTPPPPRTVPRPHRPAGLGGTPARAGHTLCLMSLLGIYGDFASDGRLVARVGCVDA